MTLMIRGAGLQWASISHNSFHDFDRVVSATSRQIDDKSARDSVACPSQFLKSAHDNIMIGLVERWALGNRLLIASGTELPRQGYQRQRKSPTIPLCATDIPEARGLTTGTCQSRDRRPVVAYSGSSIRFIYRLCPGSGARRRCLRPGEPSIPS